MPPRSLRSNWNLFFGKLNRHFHSPAFRHLSFLCGKPRKRLLKFRECPHLPAPNVADERKHPGAPVWILPIQNSQPLLPAKSRFAKSIHQRSQFRRCEQWLGWYRKPSQVQQRSVQTPLLARSCQIMKRLLARLEVQMLLGVQTDKLRRPNDLQFKRYTSPRGCFMAHLGSHYAKHSPHRLGPVSTNSLRPPACHF